ncbi:hypothetical protein COB11_05120 [Candidatus Aerophobetes bacterium]|uniref:Uncharacterized protein n=1 Tax=Aerophobetes bacterium TaxID=2030807 RepID=A0A2A4YFN7_UNCAE|nr:MAG: hypothetical protein COB11_05120 [Candidatus Aerophobetes bacterium]
MFDSKKEDLLVRHSNIASIATAALLAVGLLNADESKDDTNANDCKGNNITNDCLLKGRYDLKDDWGVSVFGSALYWQAQEEGLDYVVKNNTGTAFANDAEVKRATFDWDWGFRVGLGYQIPKEKMELALIWTRFHTSAQSSTSATEFGGLFPVWTIPGAGLSPSENARANVSLKFDMADIQMLGVFTPRGFLQLKPFMSVSAVWVDQNFDVIADGGASTQIANALIIEDKIEMKNNFFGVGPKMGLETMWILGYGISIYGNIDASLLFGWFDLSQKETVQLLGLNPRITFLDIKNNDYSLSRVNLHFNAGLRWDRVFHHDRFHLSLMAGWESLLLFGQNQLLRLPNTDSPGINMNTQGDLTMQGLTMKALFAF